MKKYIKKIILTSFLGVFIVGCDDPKTELPPYNQPFFAQEFLTTDIQTGTVLDLTDWVNYCESGTVKWKEKTYSGNGYAEFNPYGTTDASSITWLITPEIDLSGKPNANLSFKTAQNFVSSDSNTIKVYITTNYDASNFANTTWTLLDATIANKDNTGYAFISSGIVNLDSYISSGKVRIGFKAIGSGTNTSLDGLFQIDNIYVFTSNK